MFQEKSVRYIVVVLTDEVENPDGSICPIETSLVLCQNEREIFRAVDAASEADQDWSLFEVVDGRPERRAVQFVYSSSLDYGSKNRKRDGLVIVR